MGGVHSGSDLLAEALERPARDTTWVVTHEGRVEVRDHTGQVFACATREGGAVRDPAGVCW
jgi:hypothetical protein